MNNIMYPVTIKKAKGCYMWDNKGEKYLDFTSSIFTANVGHGNRRVMQAIKRQINAPLIHAYGFNTDIKEEYSKALSEYAGGKSVFLCSTGSEAIEWAIYLVREWNKVNNISGTIYGLRGAFHGKTLGAMALCNETSVSDIKPLKMLPSDIAGLFIETYEGWSGKFHDTEYIRQLRTIATQRKALVVFDEMQSGFGRTGKKWGYEWYGVEPDIIVCGKGMGGGFPLSATLVKRNIMDNGGEMSTTHSGNPLSCAVGLAVLNEIIDNDLIYKSLYLGGGVDLYMDNLKKRFDIEVNGHGLMRGVIFKTVEIADAVCEYCYRHNLLVVKTHKNSVKLAPPLIISENELIRGLDIFKEALCALRRCGILGSR